MLLFTNLTTFIYYLLSRLFTVKVGFLRKVKTTSVADRARFLCLSCGPFSIIWGAVTTMGPLPVITGHLATATSLHLYINATSLHQSYISTSLLQQCYCGPFSVFWGPVNILGPVLVIAGRHTDCKTATSLHLYISTSLLRQCYCSIVTTAVLL